MSHVYIDSSALAKRVLNEPERGAIIEEFRATLARGDRVVSSAVSWIEVNRAIRRRLLETGDPRQVFAYLDEAMTGVDKCEATDQVADLAARYGPVTLRTLDAIHLATAFMFEADVVWAYDAVLLRSAAELGFRTMSPGASIPL